MTDKTDSKERDLMELVDAYAEARHIGGCHTYNAKAAEARNAVIASLAPSGFDAADMATASAQGFRDGVASLAASAGSEPVARVNDDGFIVEIGDLLIAPGQKLYLHPSPPEGMGGGWTPIETAPKDVLVDILNNGRRYAGCHYDSICGEYRHITACGVLIRLKNATHWMPLPPPPTSSADSRKGE